MIKKITISVTRYNEDNNLVKPCINALARQRFIKADVIFLDQKYDLKIKDYCNKLSNRNIKFIYKNIPVKGHSYARNCAIKLAKTDIILYADCDAIPYDNWAYNICKVFKMDKNIAIVGGKSEPLWLEKPKWFHKANIVKDMLSLYDISNKIIETKKVVGVNFGINKKLLGKEAYFNENLGRSPGSLLSGDETELCLRCLKKNLKIYYTPYAIVKHQIQKERMSLKWIIKRAYYGGYGRAILGGLPQPNTKRKNIYDYMVTFIIVIPYIIGYIKWKLLK